MITFRGDASYFAISSLDYYPQSPEGRRQVRIYSREASSGFVPKHSATSENLPGFEGAINWRPSGNLISGLVRYGYEGGAAGKEGRWEVAMLERNGLRHGGFELREDRSVWQDGQVLGLRWNSDSDILAIWIRRNEEDVGGSVSPLALHQVLIGSATVDHEELPLLPETGAVSTITLKPLYRCDLAPGAADDGLSRRRR